ncbi:hypothetical protein [Mariprofundus ferrooxydans]|jgi:3-dehydroquinate dehydratase|uniref:Uncharacterized protein n=1 Tax=Mariprofundus ferrooxydans PV-1 TaxID=314345 RepID=Q0F1Q6_9PROT|nr:hypothetical protein [Mariprofundus ferrooxydans]EAU55135.1 hypothetical protein SPV1_10401 [Mariprofundus ferrooxydans PV-1]KON47580.1 hypothetical protein AL013_07545 [Mariprofundus ferrooxydans]
MLAIEFHIYSTDDCIEAYGSVRYIECHDTKIKEVENMNPCLEDVLYELFERLPHIDNDQRMDLYTELENSDQNIDTFLRITVRIKKDLQDFQKSLDADKIREALENDEDLIDIELDNTAGELIEAIDKTYEILGESWKDIPVDIFEECISLD